MLTPDEMDRLIQPITDLFAEYETEVIADIARRLVNLSFESAGWETQRLIESGALYADVLKRLAKLTKQTEAQVDSTLREAGVRSMDFDDSIYERAGMKPLPLNMSPAMAAALKAGVEKTNGAILNLTRTTAVTAKQAFTRAVNLAYLEVSTGTMSYERAIRLAIKRTAAQGLSVIAFDGGHQDQLDVAIRRATLTGVSQTAGRLQIGRADQMGTDLVAVSAHAGARNKGAGPMNHASWQGRVYSRSGSSPKYPDFVKVTGYGTGQGLGGWNCRHSFYPFFEGVSEGAYTAKERSNIASKAVTVNGRRMSLYDAVQLQRQFERKVRYWKRQAQALSAARLSNTYEMSKVGQWQAALRSLVSQAHLDREYERERV